MIIRQKEPNNLEAPFDQLDTFVTPVEQFYVPSHFATPRLVADSYSLHIDGASGGRCR
jgi:hypothetical protein